MINDASLVMIPSGYKDGTLYSVKPTNGDGDFTFSRGSNLAATRVNSEGLIEKGRENLLTYSNTFTSWSNIGGTMVGGQSGYDGSSNAYLFTMITGANICSQTNTQSGIQTLSVYAKGSVNNGLRLYAFGTSNSFAYFDLNIGAVETTNAVIDANIEDKGDGWYRCSMTFNQTNSNIYFYLSNNSNSNAGSGSILIQDAQLEQGLVATDYIETTTTTAQAGILEDMPRLDYSGGSCPALLLEPQRSNLLAQSEYANSSNWANGGTTYSNNQTNSPDGGINAIKLIEDSSTAFHYLGSQTSTSTAGNYTISGFIKKGSRRYGGLRAVTNGFVNRYFVLVDLDNGSVVNTNTFGSGVTWSHNVTTYNNGWYRIEITGGHTTGIIDATFGISDSASPSYTGALPVYNGISGEHIFCYGFQVEAGSYPTSYIPTYGSSVTRSADSCANTSATDIINQDEGTLFVDFVFNGKQDNIDYYHMAIIDSYAQNEIRLGGYNLALYGRVYSGGTVTFSENYTVATIGQRYKVIIKYGSEGVKTFANGILKDSGTPTLPTGTMDEIRITRNGVGTQSAINQSLYFPTALTDAECIALTTL